MIRITGGEFRGRTLKTPKGERTRPTQARLRQALFNSIQTQISEARVLDLFAGSGALGFESLSRGAGEVVFVEDARPAVKLIEANARELGVLDRTKILSESVERAQKGLVQFGKFDIVLADPPYTGGWEMKLLEGFPWKDVLSPGGVFLLEWGVQKSQVDTLPNQVFLDASGEKPAQLVKVREKNYGDSVLTTYTLES